MPSNFNHILQQTLGSGIELIQSRPLSGGDIHQAWRLDTNQGSWFIKINHTSAIAMFASEAEALKQIQASQTIRCPQVMAFGQTEHQAWLLLEYIDLQSQGDDFLRGQQLAQMHRHTADQFGWPTDNFIGHTVQLNHQQSNWQQFYVEQRLRPQLTLAQQNGAPSQLIANAERLIAGLDAFFVDYQPQASLLHGDLWGGNSAFDHRGQPVIFDPASYYGDRETDLAMTELFGGFSDDFYRGYQTEWPLDASYHRRKLLYNLYHILNHFNLFGGHYALQAQRLIDALLNGRANL